MLGVWMSRVRFNTMEKGRMKQQSLTTKQAGNVHVDVMHACMFQLASYLNPLCAGSRSAMEMRTALQQLMVVNNNWWLTTTNPPSACIRHCCMHLESAQWGNMPTHACACMHRKHSVSAQRMHARITATVLRPQRMSPVLVFTTVSRIDREN